ncbi:uncharacterized protein LOC116007955 [Ipomoea triloba]|uniref:uncharacterized protein LOC116007955 n=1 Tax=Ipomoea triloba TaxID=35885 RepID=UPI00125E77C3|nr:uncharacterized protein LOC116007955 [Ipomoea triloba]
MEARVSRLEATVADLNKQVEAQSTATRELMEKLVAQMDSKIASWKDDIVETIQLNRPPPPILETAPGGSSVNGGGQEPHSRSRLNPNPTRRRSKSSCWRRGGCGFGIRCERFFLMANIPQIEDMHVLYVNLTGKVGLWFESYLTGLEGAFEWAPFVVAVCRRFGGDSGSVMEEFTGFKQYGMVLEFTDRFEEFRSLLLQNHPTLNGGYFLEAYVARLKQNLKCFVRTAQPKSLADAIWFAKQFEKGFKPNELYRNPSHFTTKPNQFANSSSTKPYTSTYTPKPYTSKPAEIRPRNSQGSAASNSFNSTAKGPEVESEFYDTSEELSNEESAQEVEKSYEQAEISLYAMMGGEGLNTIKLLGAIGRQQLVILVDSGSTHSFLDPKLLTQLRIESERAHPLRVTVANGEQLICDSICKGMKWQVQEEWFEKDFRLLRLGGCDMVLGMDWIDQFAPIQLHTRPPGISFHKEGKRVLLKGLTRKPQILQAATKKDTKRWQKNGVQGFLIDCEGLVNEANEHQCCLVTMQTDFKELAELIQEFQDLFDEPKALPQKRAYDHSIPLIPGAQPVNKRPYRYSFDQKNTIEKMVEEMLKAGVITESVSPFASPVLLVPKKDSTWRFCIDYRALNDITVKNKFPIPLVEDLFSELAGSKHFTKLDLRAGYHQLRMKEGEEYKTAFRTHQGLYEFRVMPFGLTNAPATFQALMNHVFKPLLRRFVLVFFYDILIYSPDLKAHWNHLRAVLQLMREHKLLAKLSKCSFAKEEVEYLGHIISGTGLHTNPSKLLVVVEWPKPTTIKGLRGFLRLTGYYRRFIKGYGIISKPLTNMLKKNSFQWESEADTAFETLKQPMCSAPVLALPDFNKTFTVEADACHKGMGAVLIKEGKPIAYFSKAFGDKHLGLSIYEKEYLSIINVMEKWRSYLIGRHFIIKTDHHSLKFLLEQKITTAIQHKGLAKLLGLQYTIQYKRGVDNCATDALSRRMVDHEDTAMNAISSVKPQWAEKIAQSYENDDWAKEVLTTTLITPDQNPKITVSDGLIKYKQRLYIGSRGNLRGKLMTQMHDSPLGGHSGQQGTYQRLRSLFY